MSKRATGDETLSGLWLPSSQVGEWCAREGFAPRPSDPKSGSCEGKQPESIRAWNVHRKDAVIADFRGESGPAPDKASDVRPSRY